MSFIAPVLLVHRCNRWAGANPAARGTTRHPLMAPAPSGPHHRSRAPRPIRGTTAKHLLGPGGPFTADPRNPLGRGFICRIHITTNSTWRGGPIRAVTVEFGNFRASLGAPRPLLWGFDRTPRTARRSNALQGLISAKLKWHRPSATTVVRLEGRVNPAGPILGSGEGGTIG